MAGEPVVTIVGNLTDDPQLRFTPAGVAVCNFTVASTPRVKVKGTEQWEDGETLWVRCAVWRDAAENTAESLSKGTRVVVNGRLKVRGYEKDGERRTSIEMDVDEVGPSTKYAQMTVRRITKDGSSQSKGGKRPDPSDDPWGAAPPAGGSAADDEPPF